MTTKDTAQAGISIQVFEEFEGLVSEEWLRRVARCALDIAAKNPSGELSVVIADDETVRQLNRTHRGLDENTDVLSFAFDNQGEYYGEGESPSEWSDEVDFILPPGEGAGIGEIIISYPQAVRQAEEAGHTLEKELAHLLAHGILHLLGHDHVGPGDEEAMKAKEATILARVSQEDE